MKRIDKERIDKIQQVLDKTTPGEWKIEGNEKGEPLTGYQRSHDIVIESEYGIYIAQTTKNNLPYTERHNIEADSTFIANAKSDIQFLLNIINDSIKNGKI